MTLAIDALRELCVPVISIEGWMVTVTWLISMIREQG